MANVTTKEAYDRRCAVWESWLKGIRSIPKLADIHKTSYDTVKRDLVFCRKNLKLRVKEETLELIKKEEDSALLQDIAQIEELIAEIRASKPETVKASIKQDGSKEQSKESNPIDYSSVISLLDRKARLRRMRQELYGFISPHKGGINVAVSAQASAKVEENARNPIQDIPEPILRRIISIAEGLDKTDSSGS